MKLNRSKIKEYVLDLKDKVGRFDAEVVIEQTARKKRALKLLSDAECTLWKIEQLIITGQETSE